MFYETDLMVQNNMKMLLVQKVFNVLTFIKTLENGLVICWNNEIGMYVCRMCINKGRWIKLKTTNRYITLIKVTTTNTESWRLRAKSIDKCLNVEIYWSYEKEIKWNWYVWLNYFTKYGTVVDMVNSWISLECQESVCL